jgi:NDP-sugar pyrophosphorylase family protein
MPDRAVVLAGGVGSRLNPYTTVIPKPLLPVGDRAILDILVNQLAASQFTDLTFAVGYLSYLIEAIFGDGSNHSVTIDYHHEECPLGTVGALSDIRRLDAPFLMVNGDVLTTLDYRALYQAHIESENVMTIATHERVICTDYGVLSLSDPVARMSSITDYEEKPEVTYTVSMGVYVVSPAVLSYIPNTTRFDVPDLVHRLIAAGQPVGSYRDDGYWLDIGRHEDYQQAINDFSSIEAALFPQRAAHRNGRAARRNGRPAASKRRAVKADPANPNRKASGFEMMDSPRK